MMYCRSLADDFGPPELRLVCAAMFDAGRLAWNYPAMADVNNIPELTELHQNPFRGGVVIVERLAQLNRLRGDNVEFMALPLKIANGDGSPVRAIAIDDGP